MNTPLSVVLTELELDALTELVNLGVSNAALSLREMVRSEVLLSVPKVTVVTPQEAVARLGERETKRLVGVRQDFDGDLTGRAILIFPEAKSMELVRAVVGSDQPLEEIMELEQEALAETGNVLLNGCLGSIANNLQRTLHISLPEVVQGEGPEFFDLKHARADDSVLFIYINFTVKLRNINGYIAMLLDFPSLVTLKELLGEFVVRTTSPSLPNAGK
ncbi:MAG: chemotaxis protein CheX [Steroidobacteraceae bacterium]